jgi:molybdopterin converting factor small subunit
MRVTVRLHGLFRTGRFVEEVRELAPGGTARAVAEQLRIPVGLVGIVLIDGAHARLDDPLKDGDVVSLLPQMGGG